jgi:hypothetical protein
VPRDVLRVDKAERRLAANVLWEVRLDVALPLRVGASAGFRRRGIKPNDRVMRVDDSAVSVHHHEPGVAHHGVALQVEI